MLFNASLGQIALLLPALIFAFSIHELSHGLMAYMLGDSTAKRDGRLSLNPVRHIDPVGLLFIMLVGFGWAKPVMIDPRNLSNPKVDMALIAIAGPISNFLLAFLGLMILPLLNLSPSLPGFVSDVIYIFCILNIMLAVFNLLPIPPLDGSKVVAGVLPDSIYENLPPVGRYGMLILMLFMITGVTRTIIMPIVNAIFNLLLMMVQSIYGFLL